MSPAALGGSVLIDKAAILQALEELCEDDLRDEARLLLPEQLDADEHRHLFLRFGIDPRDLPSRVRRPRPEPPQAGDGLRAT
jgi:hypothetical protein